MRAFFLSLIIVCLTLGAVEAQQFNNLNFEAANLSSPPSGFAYVSATAAFPGWTAAIGGVTQTTVLQDTFLSTGAGISILGPNLPAISFATTIDGNYTPVLQAGGTYESLDATLTQIGTVPQGAQSLQFKAWINAPSGPQMPLRVFFNGNTLAPINIGSESQLHAFQCERVPICGSNRALGIRRFRHSLPLRRISDHLGRTRRHYFCAACAGAGSAIVDLCGGNFVCFEAQGRFACRKKEHDAAKIRLTPLRQ